MKKNNILKLSMNYSKKKLSLIIKIKLEFKHIKGILKKIIRTGNYILAFRLILFLKNILLLLEQ